MENPIYIIGHKNPDSDAICSAIAYAAFKEANGLTGYVPARCGNSNARIDSILEQFRTPLPVFIGDVTPRVRDIMVPDVRIAKLDSTCAEALEIIDQYDVRALPVVDADNRVRGQITVFHLGEFFIPKPREPRQMRHVYTSIGAIVKALHATPLCVFDENRTQDFYVRIGAMDIRSFGKFSQQENVSPDQSIIVVGDRWDIQQRAIQMGVRLLVVTGGLEVDPEVLELSRERKISLVVSPFDSATTSWIIRTATLVAPLMDRSVPTWTPEEKLNNVRRRAGNNLAPINCVVNEDGKLIGVFTKTDILKPIRTKIVLVDHNELSQAVNGAADVNIVEVIDHHRLGNQHTNQPIFFRNEPVGSTCTIIADMFRKANLPPEPQMAGIMMSGLIADTLNLQSPTATEKDAEILPWLSKIAGVSADALAERIFSSGSVILSMTPEQVIRSDCKTYEEGRVRYSVSQIEELGFNNFWANADALLEALEQQRAKDNLYFASLLVTDINSQNSLLLVQGDEDFKASISYPSVDRDEIFDLPGIVSRKKQLIPFITSILQSLGLAAQGTANVQNT